MSFDPTIKEVSLKLNKIVVVGMAALALSACTAVSVNAQSCGGASWYALHGNKTASGERMNMNAMTGAHKTLKLGTKVHVTNKRNGKSVIIRINDRGPFIRGRVLDLSKGAASKIGMISTGHAQVCYSVVS